jgi:DNA gyrase subunit B
LTRTLIECGNNANFFKNAPMPIGKDFRAGLTAVISVQVPGPQFESRNMHWLCNPEVKPVVARAVRRALRVFLNENPGEAHQIITKAISAAKARE